MSRLRFTKMHGAGNDFVMVDGRDLAQAPVLDRGARSPPSATGAAGVGADGLIVVADAGPGAGFRMTYFNADGGEAEMCGNGARCTVAFAHDLGLVGRALPLRHLRRACCDGAGARARRRRGRPAGLARPGARSGAARASPGPPSRLQHRRAPPGHSGADDVDDGGRGRPGTAPAPPRPASRRPGPTSTGSRRRPAGDAWLLRTYERGRGGRDPGLRHWRLGGGGGALPAGHGAVSPVALRTRGGDLLTVDVDREHACVCACAGRRWPVFQGEVTIA